MDNNDIPELPEYEKERLHEAYGNQDLPINLEEKIVQEIRKRRLFKWQMFQKNSYLKPAFTMFFGAVIFLTGMWLGRRKDNNAMVSDKGQYLLLLYNPASFEEGSSHAEEYKEWFHSINDRAVKGEELQDKGWTISLSKKEPFIEDEPHGNGKLSGFFIVHASSENEALSIASSCPHLVHKGVIAIRPIQSN